jgi:fructose-1-phosphate kinase PfkB-like protein
VVKVNASEAGQLTGRPVRTADNALAAARQLHEATAGAAIVTLGRDGAVLVDPQGNASAGSIAAEGRYPVGSGDAFLAGLVVALDGGAAWDDALRAALGAAIANAELPGAGVLDPGRAAQLAEACRIVPVA